MYGECFLGEFIFKYATYMNLKKKKKGFLAKFHYHVSGKFLVQKSFIIGQVFQKWVA